MIDEIVDLTQALIKIPSVHGRPSEIKRCADFIESFLKTHQLPYQRFGYGDHPALLIAPANHDPDILLMAHFDVVDGDETLFQPYIENGCLYGRGSIDDKYAVALSMILAKNHYPACQGRPRVSILLTGDEEIGGRFGACKILPQLHPRFCIALDGGSVDRIIVKEKGILTLILTARGKCAHGSRPWMGENAIENLITDYTAIKPLFEQSEREHWHRTMNFGIVSGGKAHNQVPDLARATLDVRFTENDDIKALLGELRSRIKGELEVVRCEPIFEGGESVYLDQLKQMAPSAKLTKEHGSSDARFLSDHGIPGVVWGADGDMSQHTAHEHIRISSLGRLYTILNQFIEAPPPK